VSRRSRIRVGDLVTRTYDYTIDSIPDAAKQQPYGIVLEIKANQFKDNNESVVVYWFKEANMYAEKKRVNNARFLKVVNSTHSL
jgi:hypothetical protein